jgi:hypothetical protein
MVMVPDRKVMVRTVAPPTLIVTSSAAPGGTGFQLPAMSQKPSAFVPQLTGAASNGATGAATSAAEMARHDTDRHSDARCASPIAGFIPLRIAIAPPRPNE